MQKSGSSSKIEAAPVLFKYSRFSCNTLKNNDAKVVSAMENIPDSPGGIISESLLEGMNQYYSAELAQKAKRDHTEKDQIKDNKRSHSFLFSNRLKVCLNIKAAHLYVCLCYYGNFAFGEYPCALPLVSELPDGYGTDANPIRGATRPEWVRARSASAQKNRSAEALLFFVVSHSQAKSNLAIPHRLLLLVCF